MKGILTSILEKLKTEIPELKYIDENWGQMELEQPPVKFPMAIIDMGTAACSNQGMGIQLVDATVVVTVAALRLSQTSGGVKPERREQAFEFYDLLHKIHAALHGFAPAEYSSRLTRIALSNSATGNGVKVVDLTYRLTYREKSYEQITATISGFNIIT